MRHSLITLGLLFITTVPDLSAGAIKDNYPEFPRVEDPNSKILIITDEAQLNRENSIVNAIKLYNLLGHFNTTVNIISSDQYTSGEIKKHHVIFYLGNYIHNKPNKELIKDIRGTNRTIVCMKGGIESFLNFKGAENKFGFSVAGYDSSGSFNEVRHENNVFARGKGTIVLIKISNPAKVKVIATTYSKIKSNEVPYIVKSDNLYYIADVPLENITYNDRYLLFADLLHDFTGENHPENHQAIVRIEDVTPLRDPQNLRKIADILFERHIPFVVGVVPFFVDPTEKEYVRLSDRPALVSALKYCVEKGATIAMHGVTHQYKGESCIDFEFWDGSVNKPIADEKPAMVDNKIVNGIDECVKNGIYPLMWETPHYVASSDDYKSFSGYFGSVIERRSFMNNISYGQYFPYIIDKDFYGQKVYPEDLGYVPLLSKDSTELFVNSMINNAKVIHNMRDGIASFFFHTFVNTDYLKEMADKLCQTGFKFIDLRLQANIVKTNSIVILSGNQNYTINLDHAFLSEIYYNKEGAVEKRILSKKLITGAITKKISLNPDEYYIAIPIKKKPDTTTGKNQIIPHPVSQEHS